MKTFLAIVWCGLMVWGADLSAQQTATNLPFQFQKNVLIPMRDGTQLSANIFLPKEGGPFPVILQRTPYGKMDEKSGMARSYCARGYVIVAQDCRGRGGSKGVWDPFRNEPDDGFDTQEWIGHQPWCDGHIGTSGGSYVGWTQWASAPKGSKYLTCMAPVVPFSDAFREVSFVGGALQLSLCFGWGAGVGGMNIPGDQLQERLRALPLNAFGQAGGPRAFFLRDWVEHPTYDEYWRVRGVDGRYDLVTVPVLNMGGWYDIFAKAVFDQVNQVRQKSTSPLARKNQFVVVGPWGHGLGGQKLGALDFGPAARTDIGRLEATWFDHWLKHQDNGVTNWPAVKIFVMGENAWRNESEWPLARTKYTPWYLHGSGKAATKAGDGTLSAAAPDAEPADAFTYDPANPVPTQGGNNLVGAPAGPYDQAAVEDRDDVLVYTSAPLEKAMEITGPVKMILHATSSAPDTDFTAKLVDVHPDGKPYNLCDGIIRARFREPGKSPSMIEPGKTYGYEIDLWVTSNLFQAGHRIRVEISSSNFPRFDRNPNTGHAFGVDAELAKAQQTIFHDRAHPSHLLLPIIPR
jgi:putative CocE/NonD family hydrolase